MNKINVIYDDAGEDLQDIVDNLLLKAYKDKTMVNDEEY